VQQSSWKLLYLQGAQDLKKSKLYGKIGKLIVQAAKAGGADPASNMRLKEVLAQAKLADCPKDIVDRNLKNAVDKSQADYSEVRWFNTLTMRGMLHVFMHASQADFTFSRSQAWETAPLMRKRDFDDNSSSSIVC
jgi:transcriptional/translational regulatory protein YebC/TACO1